VEAQLASAPHDAQESPAVARPNHPMTRLGAMLLLALAVCTVACTSHQPSVSAKTETQAVEEKPEVKLIGKWEELDPPKRHSAHQFEFFPDGTVIQNDKIVLTGKWQQLGTGSFKFMDPTRIKVELQPNWAFGISIYELVWQDQDHVSLRAGDKIIPLTRLKP
jgi:hypothetical protein